jgi:FkbM family methyltransferase
MQFMRHYLRPGDCFVDVGANIGTYALLAASLTGPSGRVDAFEPGPVALERLRENVALNGFHWINIHEEAVGSESGLIQFVSDQDVLNRMASVPVPAGLTRQVPCVRLDDAVGDRHYSMGKMDIEGAEPMALQGAGRLISTRNPAVWLLEINGKLRDYGFSESELAEWLSRHGYDLALYDADERTLTPAKEPWLIRDNAFAIARDRWGEITQRLKASFAD